MKKYYSAPCIEKVEFDYRVQTSSAASTCYESVMNLITGTDITSYTECDRVYSTPTFWGWTLEETGV